MYVVMNVVMCSTGHDVLQLPHSVAVSAVHQTQQDQTIGGLQICGQ